MKQSHLHRLLFYEPKIRLSIWLRLRRTRLRPVILFVPSPKCHRVTKNLNFRSFLLALLA